MRVRVIAIDGLDTRHFDANVDFADRLGTLLSTTRITFTNDGEPAGVQDPARAWTTVATGQPPDVHAVQSLETRRLAGLQGSVATTETSTVARALRGAMDLVRLTRPSIASGQERRSKTFWEIAASAGLNTVAINWWATWPAIDGAGTVLTDRVTLRLEQGGSLDAELAPASLYDSLRRRWPELKARARALAVEALGEATPGETYDILLRSVELDALQILLMSETATPTTDLSVVYLPGLDIARYALREHARRRTDPALAVRNEDFFGISVRYFRALDRLLGPILVPASDEVVMVISQPGRVAASKIASQRLDLGRLSLRGQGLSPDESITCNAEDLAPTILHLLGVPVSRDLRGKPRLELFTGDFIARYPVREVATYGAPSAPTAARSGQPLDQETIDRLRSLGYLK